MPNTGEQPGEGTYECANCEETVTLGDDTERLPACPGCGFPQFNEAD